MEAKIHRREHKHSFVYVCYARARARVCVLEPVFDPGFKGIFYTNALPAGGRSSHSGGHPGLLERAAQRVVESLVVFWFAFVVK